MTIPGRGGLPPRRVDQVYTPPVPGVPPGSSAGVVRAILVLIYGTGRNRGLFVYNGNPAAGNPPVIALTAPGVVTDPFNNAVLPGGLSIVFGGQTIFLGSVGGIPELQFRSGSVNEGTASNVASGIGGAGATQFLQMLLSGPKLNVAGANDWVQVMLNSANAGGTSDANYGLVYVDTAGLGHTFFIMDGTGVTVLDGSIVAAHPGSSPLVSESWQVMTLLNGFTAGVNNGFSDAPSYAMLPISPYYGGLGTPKCVAFRGSLVVPAGGIGSAFAQLPAAYQPQAGPFSRVNGLVNNGGGQSGRIDLHSNGNLFLTGSFAAAAVVDISGLTFI